MAADFSTPSPVSSQLVTAHGDGSTTANPYTLNTGNAGNQTFSITVPPGYSVENSLCYSNNGHVYGLYQDETGLYISTNIFGQFTSLDRCLANNIRYSGDTADVRCVQGGWQLYWLFTPGATPTPSPTPTSAPSGQAWWQVKDADIASGGDLITQVPTNMKFDLLGDGGFPGIPAADGSDLTTAKVSVPGWLVKNSLFQARKIFNYRWFTNLIPANAVVNSFSDNTVNGNYFKNQGTISPDGYYRFKYAPLNPPLDLHITGTNTNLNNRKVILFVGGADVYLETTFKFNAGTGFFMLVAEKNLKINPTVTSLQGIFLADMDFSSGTTGSHNDQALHIAFPNPLWERCPGDTGRT